MTHLHHHLSITILTFITSVCRLCHHCDPSSSDQPKLAITHVSTAHLWASCAHQKVGLAISGVAMLCNACVCVWFPQLISRRRWRQCSPVTQRTQASCTTRLSERPTASTSVDAARSMTTHTHFKNQNKLHS